MDNEITAAVTFFDSVQMDDRCTRRITAAMDAHQTAPRRREEYTMRQPKESSRFGWVSAAACLLLIFFSAGWVLSSPDRQNVMMTEPPTTAAATAAAEAEELLPPEDWLYRYSEEEGGNIFLTLQDSWIEITQELSATDPVIYCYEPEAGKIAYYALGLCDGEDPIGWYYNEYTEETGWAEGIRHNCSNQSGEEYEWYTKGLEKSAVHLRIVCGQRGDLSRPADHIRTSPLPSWLEERDGKLYFVGNRENIDISNAFSEEEPFLYAYANAAGIEKCIAIGGTYIPGNDLDTVGWTEMTKDLLLEENLATRFRCWYDGYGHGHWNNAEDREYGWYTAAKEHFGWPFP